MAANKPNSASWASRAFRQEPLSFIWKGEKTHPRLLEDINREFVEDYLKRHPNHAVIRKPSTSEIASHRRIVAVLSFIGMDGGYKHQPLEIKHMYKPYDLHYTLTNLGGNKNWEIMYDINYENANDFFQVNVSHQDDQKINPLKNNSNDTTPIESRWNDTRLFVIPQLMNRNKVEQFIKKSDGFYAVLRKPSEDAIKQANEQGYKNVIGILSFLNKDNNVAHIYLPKDYVETNDVYKIAKASGGHDNIELLVTEENMLDAKNVHNFSRMTGHGRSKKSKSRRSKTRRSKKSKGRSRRHRK